MNIINFESYKRCRGSDTMFFMDENREKKETILEEVIRKRKENKEYDISDAEYVANRLLEETKNNNRVNIPVVEIAKHLGFDTFQADMSYTLEGYIGIDDKYKKIMGAKRVVCTNRAIDPYQQRFVIAHELGHYIFDYDHKSSTYRNTYYKNKHNTLQEKRANWFAVNLLMPKKIFLEKYNQAREVDSDTTYVLAYLSEVFKVTKKATLKRMKELGCYVSPLYR